MLDRSCSREGSYCNHNHKMFLVRRFEVQTWNARLNEILLRQHFNSCFSFVKQHILSPKTWAHQDMRLKYLHIHAQTIPVSLLLAFLSKHTSSSLTMSDDTFPSVISFVLLEHPNYLWPFGKSKVTHIKKANNLGAKKNNSKTTNTGIISRKSPAHHQRSCFQYKMMKVPQTCLAPLLPAKVTINLWVEQFLVSVWKLFFPLCKFT